MPLRGPFFGLPDQSSRSPHYLRDYIAVGNYTVRGWIDANILRVMRALSQQQEQLSVEGSVVEIGVHHGRFFIGLWLTSPNADQQSLAIDLFDQQDLNVDKSGKGDRDIFLRNVKRWAKDANGVVVLAADSTSLTSADVIERVGPVRLFSIDGGHTAQIVEHDMTVAAGSLTPGGIIIGDDVFHPSWPGVAEGTLAFLDKTPGTVPFAICFNKVLFSDVEHADAYRNTVLELADHRLWPAKETELRGHTVAYTTSRPYQERARTVAKKLLGRDLRD